jgi:hypothetical protein
MISGDFTGDGAPDLLFLAGYAPGYVAMLINDGAGGFTPTPEQYVGDGAEWVAAADVDGDGDLDLAVARTPYSPTKTPGGVALYLNDGAGAFVAGPFHELTAGVKCARFGDVNGDGAPDLVAVADDYAAVLLNNGAGAFGAATFYNVPADAQTAGLAVIDSRVVAIAVASGSPGDKLAILFNDGAGSFGDLQQYDGCAAPESVLIADFEPDGDWDIFVPDYNGRRVLAFLQQDEGGFDQCSWPLPYHPSGGIVGDLIGLGTDDVIVATTDSEGVAAFVPHLPYYPYYQAVPTIRARQALAMEDFDGDGAKELAALNASGASLVRLAAQGYLAAPVKIPVGAGPVDLAIGDLDGDGNADIVTADRDAGQASVIFGLGYGVFDYPEAIALDGQATAVTLADVDGDGDLDLIVGYADVQFAHLAVFPNDGSGSFGEPQSYFAGRLVSSVVAVDLNGDGALDLASSDYAFWDLAVAFNDGAGGFGEPTIWGTAREPISLADGDVDGDGAADLLHVSAAGQSLSAWLNSGAGQFGWPRQYEFGAGTTPSGLVLGDFDGDGDLDAAVSLGDMAAVGVFWNLGAERGR